MASLEVPLLIMPCQAFPLFNFVLFFFDYIFLLYWPFVCMLLLPIYCFGWIPKCANKWVFASYTFFWAPFLNFVLFHSTCYFVLFYYIILILF